MSSASAQPIGRPKDHNWSFAGSSKVNVSVSVSVSMSMSDNNLFVLRMFTLYKCSGQRGRNLKISTAILSRSRPLDVTRLASLKSFHPENGSPGRLDTTSEPTKIWLR